MGSAEVVGAGAPGPGRPPDDRGRFGSRGALGLGVAVAGSAAGWALAGLSGGAGLFVAVAVLTVVAATVFGRLGTGSAAACALSAAWWVSGPTRDDGLGDTDHVMASTMALVAGVALTFLTDAVVSTRDRRRAREAHDVLLARLDQRLEAVPDADPHAIDAITAEFLAASDDPRFVAEVSRRCQAVLERREHRLARERARGDARLLRQAVESFLTTLDTSTVAAVARELIVPALAQTCEVRLLVEPTRAERPRVAPADRAGDPTALTFELRGGGRLLGWLIVSRSSPFGPDDTATLDALTGIIGQALDTALRVEELAHTSKTLERSLLPEALLSVRGLQLAARYLPAAEGHDVGGDFYDAIRGPDESVRLIIGDVQGKGVEAATITSVARHTLRAGALAGADPVEMLRGLNDALLYGQAEQASAGQNPTVRFVTAAVVSLAPTEGGFDAVAALGGQPPPLIVRNTGAVEMLAPAGVLLGVTPSPRFEVGRAFLGPADTLILYTDGVTEQRRTQNVFDQIGLGRLVRSRRAAVDAEGIAQLIQDTVLIVTEEEARDDVAVLVACVIPDAAPPS